MLGKRSGFNGDKHPYLAYCSNPCHLPQGDIPKATKRTTECANSRKLVT